MPYTHLDIPTGNLFVEIENFTVSDVELKDASEYVDFVATQYNEIEDGVYEIGYFRNHTDMELQIKGYIVFLVGEDKIFKEIYEQTINPYCYYDNYSDAELSMDYYNKKTISIKDKVVIDCMYSNTQVESVEGGTLEFDIDEVSGWYFVPQSIYVIME